MKNNRNTYSLLINSEEKGRSIFEGVIYALLLVAAAFSGWQFTSNSVALPRMPAASNVQDVQVAKAAPVAPSIADRS